MTLAQLSASIATDTDFWRTLAEGLCTVLAGLLTFMGRRVVKAVDALDGKLDGILRAFEKRNDKWQTMYTDYEIRLNDVEKELQHVERRRKPRA